MRTRQFELAVYGNDATASGSMDLIGQTRQYEKSSDPYTPMILVSWNGGSEMVRKALSTGTDQLLLWPFSTGQLGARVDALISARKRFIETEDYLGPERRQPKGRRALSHSIEVPNALRARVEGRPDLAPSAVAIQTARARLGFIKIVNVAKRICAIANMLRQHCDDAGFLRHRAVDQLAAIQNSLSVIRNALALIEQDHKQRYCDSVEKVATELSRSAPSLNGRGLALLEQAALALRLAIETNVKTVSAAPAYAG
ncbi:MAG: hypothetical protein O2967_07925 [Proteobacteria bacterium]|nr:hypothetical protein [Pseudomonadota bacterium]